MCQLRNTVYKPPYIYLPLPLYYFVLSRSKTPLFPFTSTSVPLRYYLLVLNYPLAYVLSLIVYLVWLGTNYAFIPYLKYADYYCILYYVSTRLSVSNNINQ